MRKRKVHKRTSNDNHYCRTDWALRLNFECCSTRWKNVTCRFCLAKRTAQDTHGKT